LLSPSQTVAFTLFPTTIRRGGENVIDPKPPAKYFAMHQMRISVVAYTWHSLEEKRTCGMEM